MKIDTILLITMWGIIAISCIVIELTTTNFITIWFALGSIIALITATINIAWYWQIGIFLLATTFSLSAGYPILKKYLHRKPTFTSNFEALINQRAIMINDYHYQTKSTGLAKIDGKIWTVISEENTIFKKNEIVLVCGIKGVKLVIKKI